MRRRTARWLRRVLVHVHGLAARRRVRFTRKALHELAALDLGLDESDACHVLMGLSPRDAAGRVLSRLTGEWMYVFKPRIAGTVVYLKLILRTDCVVVSFHEEADEHETEHRA